MSEFIPNPAPRPMNLLDQQFWDYCADGMLCFQCCVDCETWRHMPRFMCANCGSEKWGWRESNGRGTVYTWTVCHMPMTKEFEKVFPYAVLIVEMEDRSGVTSGSPFTPLVYTFPGVPSPLANRPWAAFLRHPGHRSSGDSSAESSWR